MNAFYQALQLVKKRNFSKTTIDTVQKVESVCVLCVLAFCMSVLNLDEKNKVRVRKR